MLEYAERRSALGCGSRSSRKRRRVLNGTFAEGESAVQLAVDQEDEELCDTRVMVFGTDSSWPEIGYVNLSLPIAPNVRLNTFGFVLKIQVSPGRVEGHPVSSVLSRRTPIETKKTCCHCGQRVRHTPKRGEQR